MLTALQETLQQQQWEEQRQQSMHAATESKLQLAAIPIHETDRLDHILDEESTDVEEFGAFASLLSSSSGDDSSDAAVSMPLQAEALASSEKAEQSNDPEKSTMVCRHWKSKGWCRLESNCKFLHPEQKRGITVPKGSSSSSAPSGGISRSEVPGMSATLSLANALSMEGQVPFAAAAGRKKRGGAKRSTRRQEGAVPGPSVAETDLCVPCISMAQFPMMTSAMTS